VLPPCGSERETDYGVTESLRDAEVLDRRARARAATKVKLESRLNCNIKVHHKSMISCSALWAT